jgi:uncharacterized protein (DUF2267 family)
LKGLCQKSSSIQKKTEKDADARNTARGMARRITRGLARVSARRITRKKAKGVAKKVTKKIAKFLREVARRGTGGVTFASRAGWTIPGLLTLKI